MTANSSLPRTRRVFLGHALLLMAILPQPLRLGHWDLPAVEIPGTALYVGLPDSDGHPHADGDDHARHCHEGVDACGNFSAAAGLTIPILTAVVLLGLAALSLRRRPIASTPIPPSRDLVPIAPPPRLLPAAS